MRAVDEAKAVRKAVVVEMKVCRSNIGVGAWQRPLYEVFFEGKDSGDNPSHVEVDSALSNAEKLAYFDP